MTFIKFTSAIFIWTLINVCACSTKTRLSKSIHTYNLDTIYSTSTAQLKSSKIPDSVFLMANLKHLSILGMDCNKGDTGCLMLKELPNEIANLKKLTSIRLESNAIKIIPNELSQLKNLTFLDLSFNWKISNIASLTQIQSLEFLYLQGCGLHQLPDNIADLKKLKKMGLFGNYIDQTEQERIKKALPNCYITF